MRFLKLQERIRKPLLGFVSMMYSLRLINPWYTITNPLKRYIIWQSPFFKSMNPDLVVDIGANTGEFIINIQKIFPSTNLIAFEPVDDCYKKLKSHFGNKSNISLCNVALGSENKKGQIFVSDFSPSSSIVRPEGDYKLEEIEIRKLDEYLDIVKDHKKVFIKIDVEGFELEVLKGADLFLQQSDWIYVESRILDPIGCSFKELYDHLTSRNWFFLGSYDNVFDNKGHMIYFDSLFLNLNRNSLPSLKSAEIPGNRY